MLEIPEGQSMSFFFQAEDGIRDTSVTGVQTCALPILSHQGRKFHAGRQLSNVGVAPSCWRSAPPYNRSEERRVGKECSSRWSPAHKKKKANGGLHYATTTTTAERELTKHERAV